MARPQPTREPKPTILCVDDEPEVLEALKDALRRRFRVVSTTNGFHALKLLRTESFPVVLSDIRMPLINGARFLALVRQHAPDTVRIVLSGQSTLDDAITAVNGGQVFSFLVKPCPTEELVATLDAALRYREALLEGDRLIAETRDGAIAALLQMLEAVDPSAMERAERVQKVLTDLASAHGEFRVTSDVERAAVLAQLGAVALEKDARLKLARGRPLGRDEADGVERMPIDAARILSPLPGLARVREILSGQADLAKPAVGGRPAATVEASALRIALDYDTLQTTGLPSGHAVQAMRQRGDRYDDGLLDALSSSLDLC